MNYKSWYRTGLARLRIRRDGINRYRYGGERWRFFGAPRDRSKGVRSTLEEGPTMKTEMKFKTMEDAIMGHVGKTVHIGLANGDDFRGQLKGVHADLGQLGDDDDAHEPIFFRLSRVDSFGVLADEEPETKPDEPSAGGTPAPTGVLADEEPETKPDEPSAGGTPAPTT